MEDKKVLSNIELEKVTGGANVEYEETDGEPYHIICPICFHVFESGELKRNTPSNIDLSDRYCPDCKNTVTPIQEKPRM